MSCSTEPFAAVLPAAASSRMSLSCSLLSSPDFQRRLQRCIEAGIGFAARHEPLAYSKKSSQGSTLVFMSEGMIDFRLEDWAEAICAKQAREQKKTKRTHRRRMSSSCRERKNLD